MSGAGNSQKTPLGWALNDFAKGKVGDGVQLQGKSWPCTVSEVNGQTVTVSYQINSPYTLPSPSMPVATSKYDWVPISAHDAGVAMAADAYLGGVSGLGGGTADLSQRGNLTALVFVPIGNSAWTAPGGDPMKRVVQGPNGAIVRDVAGKTVITVDGSNITILVPSGNTVTISSGGTAQPVKLADGSNSINLKAE